MSDNVSRFTSYISHDDKQHPSTSQVGFKSDFSENQS